MKALIISAAILGGVLASPVSASTTILGDTNCSGTVNAADITNVARAAVGLPMNAPDGCDGSADVNCSGVVNAADMVLIKQIAVGNMSNVPEGCE